MHMTPVRTMFCEAWSVKLILIGSDKRDCCLNQSESSVPKKVFLSISLAEEAKLEWENKNTTMGKSKSDKINALEIEKNIH